MGRMNRLPSHLKNFLRRNFFLVIIAFLPILFSCDFTTGVSRKILQAQDYVDNHQYKEAIEEYQILLELNPPKKIQHKIYYQMAEIYSIYLLDGEKALKYYERIEDSLADSQLKKIALVKSAQLSFELKKYNKAIKYYEKFVDSDNFTEEEKNFFGMQMGISYYEKNDLKNAKRVLSKISEEKENNYRSQAYFYLGQVHSFEYDYGKAIESWQKSLEFERESAQKIETKFYIANAYERLNMLEKAYRYYYSIIDFYPNPEIIKKRLEHIYQRKVSRRR